MNRTARSIPGAALAAATDAISEQPTGTPAAHLAFVALAAAAPLIREHDSAEARPETRVGAGDKENPHDH